jgi:uncharacterized protein (DUF58 family)
MFAGSNEPRPASREELLSSELAARLDRLDLASRKIFSGSLPGERRSKRRGSSVEFDDYRPYAPGDDTRHLDWSVLARMDRLFIKLFREEQDLSVTILLDASPSMDAGTPSKLIFSHRLAMALSYSALVSQNRVTIASFGTAAGYRGLPPARGRRWIQTVAEFLIENMRQDPPAPGAAQATFADALRRAARERVGSGVFVLLSDCLVREGYRPGLSVLADTGRGGFDTTVVQILSPAELDPAAERDRLSGDLRLTDSETGAAAEITVSAELIERYRRRVRGYCDDLAAFCRSRGIRHTQILSSTPVEEVVLRSLRKIGVLGSA